MNNKHLKRKVENIVYDIDNITGELIDEIEMLEKELGDKEEEIHSLEIQLRELKD